MRGLLPLVVLGTFGLGCDLLGNQERDEPTSTATTAKAVATDTSTAKAQPTVAATAAVAPPGAVATPAATPRGPCTKCATQEDFDKAQKAGGECCPVSACKVDTDCPGQRVCCRIPNGTLCGDVARCGEANRVVPKTPASLACTSAGQCKQPGRELCCKSGRRGEGRCSGLADGVKACDAL